MNLASHSILSIDLPMFSNFQLLRNVLTVTGFTFVFSFTLNFLTKSVNNESTSLVQKTYPHRAFLHNHTRTNFTCSHNDRAVTSSL